MLLLADDVAQENSQLETQLAIEANLVLVLCAQLLSKSTGVLYSENEILYPM